MTWSLVGNIKGANGSPGSDGSQGPQGEPGEPGEKGDTNPNASGIDISGNASGPVSVLPIETEDLGPGWPAAGMSMVVYDDSTKLVWDYPLSNRIPAFKLGDTPPDDNQYTAIFTTVQLSGFHDASDDGKALVSRYYPGSPGYYSLSLEHPIPGTHADSHFADGYDPITPADIGAVPVTRQITAAIGLQGGGTLASTVALGLSAGSQASLALADTSVQPARSITAGTGLSGGGDLSADRTLSVTYGTTAGTAAQGNDSRLSNARTPTSHASSHATGGGDPLTPANIGAVSTGRLVSSGTGLSGGGDLSADRTLSVSFGSTGSTACVGNDSRLSDARTPTSHASSHVFGGSDPILGVPFTHYLTADHVSNSTTLVNVTNLSASAYTLPVGRYLIEMEGSASSASSTTVSFGITTSGAIGAYELNVFGTGSGATMQSSHATTSSITFTKNGSVSFYRFTAYINVTTQGTVNVQASIGANTLTLFAGSVIRYTRLS